MGRREQSKVGEHSYRALTCDETNQAELRRDTPGVLQTKARRVIRRLKMKVSNLNPKCVRQQQRTEPAAVWPAPAPHARAVAEQERGQQGRI